MKTQRVPVRETYDALLELGPWEPTGEPQEAYAIIKRTYAVVGAECSVAAPEPLQGDYRDPAAIPRLQAGTDYWPFKPATDVVVRGSAFARSGAGVRQMTITASLGGALAKSVLVTGCRVAREVSGRVQISDPEPFVEMQVTYENAYGGVDPRVRPVGNVSVPQFAMAAFGLELPGTYPRNPLGRGYVVGRIPAGGLELPNVEDPTDLLSADRLVTPVASRWHEQPLPWCFDWTRADMFPRCRLFRADADAWFPGPDDERLTEVRRGYVPTGFGRLAEARTDAGFFQEASLGMVLERYQEGETVLIEGMTPDSKALEFELPEPIRRVEFVADGVRHTIKPRVHGVCIRPVERSLTIVFGASITLPRRFIPGVHRRVPLSMSVDGDDAIEYQAPPTIHDAMVASGLRSPRSEGR